MFLRNAWYVAAISGEINQSLKPIKILGERLVFYRTKAGAAVALEDACPHRKLPLSMGCLKGDTVECGYHGLTFDSTGTCVDAATQKRIPPSAKVRSYPTVDKLGLLWVWMGNSEKADSSKIIDIDNYQEPAWGITSGDAMTCYCNYLYLTDNLLDPSHVAWVHRTSFAAQGTENTPLETTVLDDGLVVSRWVYDSPVPPFYESLVQFSGRTDRLQHYEVRYPSIAINKSIFAPVGKGGSSVDLSDDTYVMISYNFMTPVDEDTTRYHWLQQRNTEPNNADVTKHIAEGARMAFNEDKEILEAVHSGMKNKTSKNLDLALDAGSLRFRRGLEKLIQLEQESEGQ